VQEYQVGDGVWARPEDEPNGPLTLKEIEECFETQAEIWHLHVRDQVIRTTAEHPFWVKGQGWMPTRELQPGDVLVGRDGEETSVADLCATGVWETVYKFRVADYHTYYVGDADWRFSVWAHNLCRALEMEQRARNVAAARGEAVIETQWAINPVTGFGRGFDFASVVGTGASARLILNEVKSNRTSMVRAESFTAFGLGAGGSRTMQLNVQKAAEAIEASALDTATKQVVLNQLRDRVALIRVICRRSSIDSNTTSFVQSETGMTVRLGF
jgi:hypothetical protein